MLGQAFLESAYARLFNRPNGQVPLAQAAHTSNSHIIEVNEGGVKAVGGLVGLGAAPLLTESPESPVDPSQESSNAQRTDVANSKLKLAST